MPDLELLMEDFRERLAAIEGRLAALEKKPAPKPVKAVKKA